MESILNSKCSQPSMLISSAYNEYLCHCLFRLVQLFAHIASDAVLKPLGHFAQSPLAAKYPPICAGDYVEQELSVINLKGQKEEP